MGNCTSRGAGSANARILKQQMQHVPDTIGSLFESYAGAKISLSVQDVQQVLIDQRINNSEATARQLIVKHKRAAANGGPSQTNGDTGLELDLPGFASLLLDPDVNALHEGGKVMHNMNQPLPQYFIQSAGQGLQGVAGDVATSIAAALRDGSRVIHLEVQPDGDKFRLSSGGMTAPFNEVIAAVKSGAFVSSEFPVILVIESHLSPPLEELLAQHLKATLGESLYVPPNGPRGCAVLSPSELKRKFVIADVATEGRRDEATAAAATPTSVLSTANGSFANGNGAQVGAAPANKGAFASLVYFRALIGSEPTDFADKVGTVANLSEAAFSRLADTNQSVLAKYASDNLVRIAAPGDKADPAGPLTAWAYGAQIVPVDAQVNARHLWLQQGFFSANGGCGYVKKPDLFKNVGSEGAAFDPKAKRPVKTTLKIMVVWSPSAKTAGRPDTFVRIASYGVPADQEVYDTATCPGGGHPATWETQEFHFPLTVPELALLALEVRDLNSQHQEVLAFQAYLPVTELRPGLRAITMRDATGAPLPGGQGRLLVHVELTPAEVTGPLPLGGGVSAPPLVPGVPGAQRIGAPGPVGPQGAPGAPQYGPGGHPHYAQAPPPPQQVVHTRYQETIVHERRRSPVAPFLGGMLVGRMLAPRPRQQVVVVNNKAPAAPTGLSRTIRSTSTRGHSINHPPGTSNRVAARPMRARPRAVPRRLGRTVGRPLGEPRACARARPQVWARARLRMGSRVGTASQRGRPRGLAVREGLGGGDRELEKSAAVCQMRNLVPSEGCGDRAPGWLVIAVHLWRVFINDCSTVGCIVGRYAGTTSLQWITDLVTCHLGSTW